MHLSRYGKLKANDRELTLEAEIVRPTADDNTTTWTFAALDVISSLQPPTNRQNGAA
jgi:hypothetical protein